MVTKYKDTLAPDGTVVQGSTVTDYEDYPNTRMYGFILGVVLDVYTSDILKNRSSQQKEDRQGFTQECTVLAVNDGGSAYTVYENVMITPDAPVGLDDYSERLPRPCSAQVSGGEYDSSLQGIDPYSLDGDWCVIGFIGGMIDAPFVVRWWPNARNSLDAATSGNGVDQTSLVQDRRYFRRINGVETVINSSGDIILSTTFANSTLLFGEDPALGRLARSRNEEEGGSVRVYIKPSQTLELTFNPQEEGIGIIDVADPELPQTNPPQTEPEASGEVNETYLYIDRDQADLYIPISLIVTTDDFISLTSVNKITFESEKIYLGLGAEGEDDPVVLGEKLREWFTNPFQVLSPFGPLKIDPTVIVPSSPYDTTLSEKSFVE